MLLPARKMQLMEHDTPRGQDCSFVTQSSKINNRTILNAEFMNECSLILAVSTNAIHACILASILLSNLVIYFSFS